MAVQLNVNGRTHRIDVPPETPLIYVLRNDLGLKGAKFACGMSQCGACNVIIDGKAVPSCHIPVGSARDSEITTIEGIGTPDDLHPLQQAFVDEQAVQCGYCVPGMIMTAKALLDREPNCTDKEIRRRLGNNLCRCGIYDRVVRAIRRAAGHSVEDNADRETITMAPDSSTAKPSTTDGQAGSLRNTPDLDVWIRINKDGTVTVFTGKVELGQDIRTSLAMIAAEELDVSLDRIRMVMEDTAQTPNEGFTGSSLSLETSGNAVRNAAAEARHLLLSMVSEKVNAPIESLSVSDGTISDPISGYSVTYWEFFGGKRFERKIEGVGHLKQPGSYSIVSHSVKRIDSVDKVTGRACFVQDLDLPNMAHGRVVRPPNHGARLQSVDVGPVDEASGIIRVVRDGSFLAVIAEREEQAVAAAKALGETASWNTDIALPTHEALNEHMMSQQEQAFLVVDGIPGDDPIPPITAPPDAAHTLTATYSRPYLMHASIGPSAAVAHLVAGQLTVWSHAQGVYALRRELAKVLEMTIDDIHAVHMDGAGSFGHNGANDAALDAALLARALPGRPVSVKWSRRDEHTCEPYGSPAVIEMQASLDGDGAVMDWNHDVRGYSHVSFSGREPDRSPLLGAWYLSEPFKRFRQFPIKAYLGGIHRNATPIYTFPERRIVKRFLPDSPLRNSSLRGLGSYVNVFAIESFMDELAEDAGIDAVEFRLRNLADERARAVLEAVMEKGGWQGDDRTHGRGWGVALCQYKNLQCYSATYVVLRVDTGSGDVSIERAVLAADVGQIVNPDSARSQLEGTFTQSASWTLKEEVKFDEQGVTSVDWHTYPIARFRDGVSIETVLINRPGEPYLGLGEGAMGPVSAAIANAIFRAAAIRMRRLPFTPERVRAALSGM
jgi:CO/xanthine dehydrogenase Mo-binding subunit/aerobic-type carbon monoxide dehydrogenase small subunit (CoxS/CutS family)|tara:strand:- start:136 stop:2811 length:2676 start_codon:yes stop_codon:yes gene_type:complete